MIEIHPRLYVGSEQDCFFQNEGQWAVIHACKIPCHQSILGYSGSLPQNHPNYLFLEKDDHLFLNIVDMTQPLAPKFADPIFQRAIAHIEKNIETKKILIHCNWGQSRSASIAMLYLARINEISSENYDSAKSDFLKKYPSFNPGFGIQHYMKLNWERLLTI